MEQVRFVSWFRKNFPDYLIFAIPNGGYRSKPEASRLKAEGVLAGVHDLYIPGLDLWIEMKEDATKKPSKAQKDWGAYVETIGQYWFVGYGYEDAKDKTLGHIRLVS